MLLLCKFERRNASRKFNTFRHYDVYMYVKEIKNKLLRFDQRKWKVTVMVTVVFVQNQEQTNIPQFTTIFSLL